MTLMLLGLVNPFEAVLLQKASLASADDRVFPALQVITFSKCCLKKQCHREQLPSQLRSPHCIPLRRNLSDTALQFGYLCLGRGYPRLGSGQII